MGSNGDVKAIFQPRFHQAGYTPEELRSELNRFGIYPTILDQDQCEFETNWLALDEWLRNSHYVFRSEIKTE